jgi:hypothetical protein
VIAGLLVVGAVALPSSPEARGAEAPVGIPCEGDECQGPPPAPDDPVPGTAVVEGPPNPPVRFPQSQTGKHKKEKKKHKRRHGEQRRSSRTGP